MRGQLEEEILLLGLYWSWTDNWLWGESQHPSFLNLSDERNKKVKLARIKLLDEGREEEEEEEEKYFAVDSFWELMWGWF